VLPKMRLRHTTVLRDIAATDHIVLLNDDIIIVYVYLRVISLPPVCRTVFVSDNKYRVKWKGKGSRLIGCLETMGWLER